MQRAIWTALLSTISEPQLYYYRSPPSRDVASSWLRIVAESGGPNSKTARPYAMPHARPRGCKAARLQVLLRRLRELRLMHHIGVTTMWGLDHGHLHPLHRAAIPDSRTAAINASQSGIEPRTSCTAGKHSMQRAIRTALLCTISEPHLYYYKVKFCFCFLFCSSVSLFLLSYSF